MYVVFSSSQVVQVYEKLDIDLQEVQSTISRTPACQSEARVFSQQSFCLIKNFLQWAEIMILAKLLPDSVVWLAPYCFIWSDCDVRDIVGFCYPPANHGTAVPFRLWRAWRRCLLLSTSQSRNSCSFSIVTCVTSLAFTIHEPITGKLFLFFSIMTCVTSLAFTIQQLITDLLFVSDRDVHDVVYFR